MEITLQLRSTATLVVEELPNDPYIINHVTLSGRATCTRPEPVDLWPEVFQDQGGDWVLHEGASERSIPCTPDGARWTETFDFHAVPRLSPGEARVNLLGCTNPAESIDEDCSRYNRTVTLVSG